MAAGDGGGRRPNSYGEASVLNDHCLCAHELGPGQCSYCAPKPPRPAPKPAREESIVSHAESLQVVGAAIEQAGGRWIGNEELTSAVLEHTELGPRIRSACASGETEWNNPKLLAGNSVGQYSASWTNGNNPDSTKFERRGRPGSYEYRSR